MTVKNHSQKNISKVFQQTLSEAKSLKRVKQTCMYVVMHARACSKSLLVGLGLKNFYGCEI